MVSFTKRDMEFYSLYNTEVQTYKNKLILKMFGSMVYGCVAQSVSWKAPNILVMQKDIWLPFVKRRYQDLRYLTYPKSLCNRRPLNLTSVIQMQL